MIGRETDEKQGFSNPGVASQKKRGLVPKEEMQEKAFGAAINAF